MEVVQGKSTDTKIIIAQEIAFAKVLAGNNKTLRDRALQKLKKWLSIRGHGKWVFTEDDFIRIWTGLFYCMWMSDKFLIQEELAENISNLIHCFRKNKKSALLFMKCFNKRLLMEYEGLDQYRIDKFNLLIRRFLRQCFVYCKRINWDKEFSLSMTRIFSDTIFDKNSALGYVLHFMSIYPEELAKVSQGKLENEKILLFIEPFVKLLAISKEDRVVTATLEFFDYLMRQTDAGIEFSEKFRVWKQLGFPGSGLNSIKREPIKNGHLEDGDSNDEDHDNDDFLEELSENENDMMGDKPLDPRAGSVHVDLPQIPLDIDGLICLFKKYQRLKSTNPKSKRKIRTLIQKFSALKKGKYPLRIKKDPIIDDTRKKTRLTIKTAKNLLKYTENIDKEPIKSKEFIKINEELQKQEAKINGHDSRLTNNGSFEQNETGDSEDEEDNESEEDGNAEEADEECETKIEGGIEEKSTNELQEGIASEMEAEETTAEPESIEKDFRQIKNEKENDRLNGQVGKKKKLKKNRKKRKRLQESGSGNSVLSEAFVKNKENASPGTKKIKKREKKKKKSKLAERNDNSDKTSVVVRKGSEGKKERRRDERILTEEAKALQTNGNATSPDQPKSDRSSSNRKSPSNEKNGMKRKSSGDWVVEDFDSGESKRQKLEESEERPEDGKSSKTVAASTVVDEGKNNVFVPVFWNRAKAKALGNKTKPKKQSTVFLNPLALREGSDSSNLRRISFALEKNMAQENDEYLEEVRNSPKVPFDGSKKPVQSALKSGLSPSPINPFYRLKKIKF